MIEFQRYKLKNGLTVILHPEPGSKLAIVNVLYRAGSIYEDPGLTGLAHLFEHMMFAGTRAVPDFDVPIQRAGGENNAYTANDYANYYTYGPPDNLSLLLWLEADRMHSLTLEQEELTVQKMVVVEEFYETCLDEPYGDFWHFLCKLAYKEHPYQWPVIGAEPAHIAAIQRKDIVSWYLRYYSPSNAILCIGGDFNEVKIRHQIEQTFGALKGIGKRRALPDFQEPAQLQARSKVIYRDVPADAFYLAYRIPSRIEPEFYTADIITDILATGASSLLQERLVKKQQLLFSVDAYTNDVAGPGLLIIEGKCYEGTDPKEAVKAVKAILDELKQIRVETHVVEKAVHKTLTTIEFSEYSTLNKAINLAYYEYLGDITLINRETEIYNQITPEQIQRTAAKIFRTNQSNLLFYLKKR